MASQEKDWERERVRVRARVCVKEGNSERESTLFVFYSEIQTQLMF